MDDTHKKNEYDVIIIGGGINGVGIARDCALRGIKALLLEKHDFARGASGNNTGMIHGGIRYLKYDVGTTKNSCIDAGYVAYIAPHLLFRVPFIYPVFKGESFGRFLLDGAEIFFSAYDRFQKLKGGKPHARLSAQETLQLEPGLASDLIGAVTMDEWGVDSFRLCLENALDAKMHGAEIKTYCEFSDFLRDASGSIKGVRYFDKNLQTSLESYAPVVINATGAWGPRIASKMGVPYKLRQGKGVHLVFSQRISNYGLLIFAVDGRQMFFLPHDTHTVIGTTDDDYYSDLDTPPILEDEVKYILQAARRIFPKIDDYRATHAYVGVRPTIYAFGKNEDALSREHAVIDHSADDIPGLFSVTGGKLAAYRQLAQEVSDLVAQKIGNNVACSTHEQKLPGALSEINYDSISKNFSWPKAAAQRLVRRHGGKSTTIATQSESRPELKEEVCACEPVLRAEIDYSAEQEILCHLHDICARTKLGMGLCGGSRCLSRASSIIAQKKEWGIARQMVELQSSMDQLYQKRRPVLGGASLATEELNRATHFLSANLNSYFLQAQAEYREIKSANAPAESVLTR